ncbi:unnamed protein product, partial [Prunus brigantina]
SAPFDLKNSQSLTSETEREKLFQWRYRARVRSKFMLYTTQTPSLFEGSFCGELFLRHLGKE